jgi:hypothetical protein
LAGPATINRNLATPARYAMPFSVTCPKCNTALNAPESVAGRRVSCKKCGEVFVADDCAGPDIVAEPPPLPRTQEPRPRSDDDIRGDRKRRYRDDEDSGFDRRQPGRRRRKISRGRPLLFVFIGLGALLLCCGGGIGIGIYYSMYAEGKPTDYQSEEGTFTATFPGTPERVVLEVPRPVNGNAGFINYLLETWGGVYEVTVRGLDSRQIPGDGLNLQNAELLLDLVADNFNSDGTMQVVRKSAVTHGGRKGIEIEIKNSTPQYCINRMFLVNNKLYVISVTTTDRPPDRKKVTNFLNSLRIHDTDGPAINRK